MFVQGESNSNPYKAFDSTLAVLIKILEIFDEICINVFRFANWILFFVFLAMGINLLITAKEKEKQERIHGKNQEYVQKRGRCGAVIFILIGIGFLFKGLAIFLLICFQSSSAPPIFYWLNLNYLHEDITSLEDISKFNVFEISIFFLISLLSFISIILISVGTYFILFNKRVLRTRYKSFSFFILGLVMGMICGFTSGLLLTI